MNNKLTIEKLDRLSKALEKYNFRIEYSSNDFIYMFNQEQCLPIWYSECKNEWVVVCSENWDRDFEIRNLVKSILNTQNKELGVK